jgi:glucan phosphoethanolaminetransferase (alkaline phosphatase superfamily)
MSEPVRRLLLLRLACAAPLLALAAWFGLADPSGFGEGRCSSCGVEGYVIAAHLVAAVWLAGVVAYASALRRREREGVFEPGPTTVKALAAAGAYAAACLLWHPLLTPLATAALVASFVLFPAFALWWIVEPARLWHKPPQTAAETDRRLTFALVEAWVALVVLLPAVFAWVWTDRVDWIVF